MSAWRRWLQLDAASVLRQSCSLGVQVGEAAPRGPTVVPGCYDNAEPLPGELRVAITADAAGLLFNLR